MDKLLTVGGGWRQQARIRRSLGNSFELIEIEPTDEALSYLNRPDHGIIAVLLYLDQLLEDGLAFLQHTSSSPTLSLIPVIVITADPSTDYLKRAMRRGAHDYINLNVDSLINFQRIQNIVTATKHNSPRLEAMNTFMFHKCIGPALMLEADGDQLHGIMINDDFYNMLGFQRERFDNYRNDLMETVLPYELDTVREAIREALETGFSRCITTNEQSSRSFQVTYHKIAPTENGAMFLVMVKDVTKRLHTKEVADALLQLPGMILYDYDVKTDTTNFYITTKKNKTIQKTVTDSSEPSNLKWVAPESYLTFNKHFNEALKSPCSGTYDLRVTLIHPGFSWHKMYYRSITDKTGAVCRIVGRLDDLESSAIPPVKSSFSGICDVETHLPTYWATTQFTETLIQKKKTGILMLLDIDGLNYICKDMDTLVRQTFLREIVQKIKDLFVSTDTMGRFGEEGFMIFLPETSSIRVAKRKAGLLLSIVEKELSSAPEHSCNIGISLVEPSHADITSVINDANIALLEAKKKGSGQYAIFGRQLNDT